ncbi:MAG: hypothetical protein MK212_00330 [Saprospiraceae bacterium]|nr:hypothetical protein [Saprospiraceae bacterium]
MKTVRMMALLNTLGFIATITLNTLANALPLNGMTTGELSAAYPNLFVPAGFTFSIWGVIYLWVLIFVVYQNVKAFSKQTTETDLGFLKQLNYGFFFSCLANAIWIVAWHYQYVLLSLVIMLLLLGSLIYIYQRLQIGIRKVSRKEKLLVHAPFSIYLGWITVATIANTTAFLVHINWDAFGILPEIWTTVMLAIGTVIGLNIVGKRKDPAYGLVIVWAYFGIVAKRMNLGMEWTHMIVLTALIGMTLVGILALGQLFRPSSNS